MHSGMHEIKKCIHLRYLINRDLPDPYSVEQAQNL